MKRPRSLPLATRMRIRWIGLGLALAALGAQRPGPPQDWRQARAIAQVTLQRVEAWYVRTSPGERTAWGGLTVAGLAGLTVVATRGWRLRRGRVVPGPFADRFLPRLREGLLDPAKAADYCELNPSPAARVALAVLQRSGRPEGDLERGGVLARQREVDALRQHVGTLRRIAALAPLLGLVGTLSALEGVLRAWPGQAALGPALAGALAPLTAGVVLAILALVGYDGLAGRVERLDGELGCIAAEVIDAMALALPAAPSGASPAAPRRDRSAPQGLPEPHVPHPWNHQR